MKIHVAFPDIMKMKLTTTIEAADNANLTQIKSLILEKFWEVFQRGIGSGIQPHGSINMIILKSGETEMSSEEVLKEHLKISTCFQVTFTRHPLS
jgi:hypothetical protein